MLGFRLFNTALIQSVSKMTHLTDTAEFGKFRKMCSQSPNAYLYAQLVLLTAGRAEGGNRLMRLFAELEKLVVFE